jgi:alpha-amylase
MTFSTPSEIADRLQPIAAVHVPHPISWADEERDLTAWLGNEMQEDAFNRLYSLVDKINKCHDKKILTDWKYLQSSDHFYYMCTKVFSDGDVHQYFNPFNSPYDAYINYMNILSDFIIRLNTAVPESDQEKEVATLAAIIYEKNLQLETYEKELTSLKIPQKKAKTETKIKTESKVKIKKTPAKAAPKAISKGTTKTTAKAAPKATPKVKAKSDLKSTPKVAKKTASKKSSPKKSAKENISTKKSTAIKSTSLKSKQKIKPTK